MSSPTSRSTSITINVRLTLAEHYKCILTADVCREELDYNDALRCAAH